MKNSIIGLIVQREYLTRVRKRSFLVMTILGPLLFAAYILIPMYLGSIEDKEEKLVAVIDQSMLFSEDSPQGSVCVLEDKEYLRFQVVRGVELETFQETFSESPYYAILFIPENILASETSILYSGRQTSAAVKDYIERSMEAELEQLKLQTHEIQNIEEILEAIESHVRIRNVKWNKEGESLESNARVIQALGYLGGTLIFFFIFMFGSQVMQGVIEEKVSRIIEVIVSSVKPFQLMMGKIIGVGLVGLTQFLLWMVLSFLLITGIRSAAFPELNQSPTEQVLGSDLFDKDAGPGKAASGMAGSADANESAGANESAAPSHMPSLTDTLGEEFPGTGSAGAEVFTEVISTLKTIKPGVMILSFLIYFFFGYLLYAAMFAVVGSMVDNETDTRQLVWPVTLPLIIGIYVMIMAINNPDSSVAFWFSLIPFTSPVVMMARIPFGVPWWQIWTSMALLVLSFVVMTWIAARIYRTGILMYGKKTSYREIWKWIRYKN